MTQIDLKSLGRTELLEMLLAQTKEVERLQGLLNEANQRLDTRTLQLDQAGNIATAALQVNGVFDAAQSAAEQYLDNIRNLSGRQEAVCARMEADAQARANQILAEATARCEALENETVSRCVSLVQKAKLESEAYWDDVTTKLNQFIDLHAGLRDMLQLSVDVAPARPPVQGM